MKLTKHQLAETSGIRVETLDLWIEQEWVVPGATAGATPFADVDVARVRLILELQSDFGANDAGITLILHLMDQLHGTRQALARIRTEMQRPHD